MVKVDAYTAQSYGRAEIWKDGAWSRVHSIAGELLATRVSYVSRDVSADAFDADIAELTRVCTAVLS